VSTEPRARPLLLHAAARAARPRRDGGRFVEAYRDDVARFLRAIERGELGADGSTSQREAYFLHPLSTAAPEDGGDGDGAAPRARWEVRAPPPRAALGDGAVTPTANARRVERTI